LNQANYWKLGAFVLGGLALAFAGLVWLGAGDWNRQTRTIVTYFDESVQGLEVGSALKFRGVGVGTVTQISIAEDLRHVKVTAQAYEDVLADLGLAGSGERLRAEAGDKTGLAPRIQLASAGITGVKFLLVDYFDARRSPIPQLPFDPGPDYIPSTPSTLKSIEEAVVDVGMQLPMLTMRASETLVRLTDAVERFETTLEPLVAKDGAVVHLLSQYERTGAEFQELARSLKGEMERARLADTTASMREAAASFSGLSAEATVLIDGASGTVSALQDTLESVRALADYLERDPSSIVRGRPTPARDGRAAP
jgi:phospholipid/cholesterol/gamma-HCH transport system substrate-binding protein